MTDNVTNFASFPKEHALLLSPGSFARHQRVRAAAFPAVQVTDKTRVGPTTPRVPYPLI